MAAIYFELSVSPSLFLDPVTNAAVGLVSAVSGLVGLKAPATVTILAINVVMLSSILGMLILRVSARATAAIYAVSFFFPDLADFFPEW